MKKTKKRREARPQQVSTQAEPVVEKDQLSVPTEIPAEIPPERPAEISPYDLPPGDGLFPQIFE